MAIASITQYLNSADKPYHHGRALYEQYGDNKAIMALIRSGSGNYHRQRLIEALQQLNTKANLEPKKIVIGDYVPPPPAPGRCTRSNPDFTDAPAQIEAIRQEKTLRFAQARKLHETIRVMDSKEHRLAAGLELLDHMDFVNEAWGIIDQWHENGQIREIKKAEAAKTVADMNTSELIAAAKNLPTYITKARNNIAAEKKPEAKIKYTEKLEQLQVQLLQVKERLANVV